jgi:regulator of RNase E activity RraA
MHDSDSTLGRLRALDVCVVSDALDSLKLDTVVTGVHPVWPYPGVIAGRVRTVQAGPRESDKPAGHIAAAAVDSATDDHVIVIANAGRLDVSCWGGILSLAAITRGVAGSVIDGACRDAAEAAELGYPVFARRVVPVSARGRIVQLAMDEPITFGHVSVSPQDYVIADATGVAFIPAEHVSAVLLMAEAIHAGRPVAEVMHDSKFPTPSEVTP